MARGKRWVTPSGASVRITLIAHFPSSGTMQDCMKHEHCCLLFHESGLHPNSRSGYSYYDQNSSLKTTFRPTSMPAYRDDFLPLDTNYKEREQNNRWAMSCNLAWQGTTANVSLEKKAIVAKNRENWFLSSFCSGYGCHRNPAWHDTLRAPRNPFAGSKLQEMRFPRLAKTQFSGICRASCTMR